MNGELVPFIMKRRSVRASFFTRISFFAVIVSLFSFGALFANTSSTGKISQIAEKYPNGLPRYLTPEECEIPIESPTSRDINFRSPPVGTVRSPAEYESQEGLFIVWQDHSSFVPELAVPISNENRGASVTVVVDSETEQADAYNQLQEAGANMSRIRFVIYQTNSIWIRDYGPRFIFENGIRMIIDYTYNRPRPNDDLISDYLAENKDYDMPLVHGGGNFHLFSNGDAFITSLIENENPSFTEQQIKDLFYEYQHVNLTIYPAFPSSYDSTQHIDMWMLPVRDKEVIIAQYNPADGEPYTITENAVADLESRGYRVYRMPAWKADGTHYTYTNAVILNNQVFVSYFGGSWTSYDKQALDVFRQAFPEHIIYPVYSGKIIQLAGALHCIVMQIPAIPEGRNGDGGWATH